jgi:phosphatidate cytidylyltransferase
MSPNMIRRVAVAAVGIPAALGLVYLGGWVLAGLLALFGVAGAAEFYRLGARSGVRSLVEPGYLAAAAFPLVAFALTPEGPGLEPRWALLGVVGWLIVTVAVAVATRRPADHPLESVSLTVFAACYAGGLPAFLLAIRHADTLPSAWAATWLVFLPLVVTWVSDSLAMGGGSLVGGPKLAPVVSPNKTWAGAISGAVGGAVLAPLYGLLVLEQFGISIAWWLLVAFGLVVSVVGQVGDLAESLFKRQAGVKDSGSFFPGHGGVLDRFDSLYWVLPTSVALLAAFGIL